MSIDFDLTNGVALITINRPERANALDAEHYAALSAAWVRVRDDDAVRAAIITGAGDKVFSAGSGVNQIWGSVTVPYTYKENITVWPIPQTEIEMNPKLTQNPGW